MTKYSVILRQIFAAFVIIVSLNGHAHEGEKRESSDQTIAEKSPAPKNSALSADIYEKEESSTVSFSGRVNLIRETDIIEVFFDGKNKGPYVLKEGPSLGELKEKLIKSQKNKNQNVNVKITDDVITSVELTESKAPANKKSDLNSVLDDMIKK
ncbi:MAG: hypothetical protein JNL11_06935 [Bdellovibrionaceae bacterium]|nr:hypothetical protein [Pseudobdellovibrionaceae bacterium]